MTTTDNTVQAKAHTPEPWDYDTDFIVAPDPAGHHPDIYIAEIVRDDDEGRIAPYEQPEANARRIVATVNACKGLRTEALERGIVAELRHILGELLTAAGDLDAAIDGTTEEFNAERTKLTPALHTAQAVLDGGMALDLHELLANRREIAAIWCIADVQTVRPDLTDDKAWEVLQEAQRKHDAMMGISWDALEILADELFSPTPETAAEEE